MSEDPEIETEVHIKSMPKKVEAIELHNPSDRLLLEECAAELRALEWSGPVVTFLGEGTFSTCPECGASQRKGHIPKCPYASLLRRLSET